MLINVIQQDSAQICLAWLKTAASSKAAVSILHFRFAEAGITPDEQALLTALAPLLSDRQASIYSFVDGDVALAWSGTQAALLQQVTERLYRYFAISPDHTLHQYYDLHAHKEAFRAVLLQKMELPEQAPSVANDALWVAAAPTKLPILTEMQLREFQKIASQRKLRKKPEILIVEDQAFSRKLLQSVLEKTYKTLSAANAASAYEQHMKFAPDILMLDIELPDMNGHLLAEAIREFDREVFIIMVTANHYLEDVTRAKAYGAKSFVAKPYTMQKILDAIHYFKQ